MICNLTIGATVVELAGGLGRASETSGLRIGIEPSFERVAYIGVNEARQFTRPGASVSVSFDSAQTFATLNDAETYILGLPADLIDQTGATAEIGHGTDFLTITGTLTSDGSSPVVFPDLYYDSGANKWSDNVGGTADYQITGSSGAWSMTSVLDVATWTSSDAVARPDLVTTWTPTAPATGTPVVALDVSVNPSLTIHDAEAIVSASHHGATVRLSVSISGRLTSP